MPPLDGSVTNLTWLKRANCDKDMLDWKAAFDLIEKMNRAFKYDYSDKSQRLDLRIIYPRGKRFERREKRT